MFGWMCSYATHFHAVQSTLDRPWRHARLDSVTRGSLAVLKPNLEHIRRKGIDKPSSSSPSLLLVIRKEDDSCSALMINYHLFVFVGRSTTGRWCAEKLG